MKTLLQKYTVYSLLAFTLLTTGCATKPPAVPTQNSATQGSEQTFYYECGDFEFVAQLNTKQAVLFLPSETIFAPKAPATLKNTFTSDKASFTRLDQTGLLRSGETVHTCQNNRSKAIWEHAKLSGIDFRAVGNEPGWSLELTQATSSSFTTNYGTKTYSFLLPAPKVSGARETTYHILGTESHEPFTIILEGKECFDTMSGEEFETQVQLLFADKKYTGCGRALH